MDPRDRRAFARIAHPEAERPRFLLDGQACEVLNCSEQGLHLRWPFPEPMTAGRLLEGWLRFPFGEEIALRGRVVRAEGDRVSLRLLGAGIPRATLLRERIYLGRLAR